jgi:hypothetical protein
MKRSFLFAAALLWFGTPCVVAHVEADCAQTVHRWTLELTSLESESDASDEQVAAEQARLGPKAAVLGDYDYPEKSGQEIYLEVREGERLGTQSLQQGQVP